MSQGHGRPCRYVATTREWVQGPNGAGRPEAYHRIHEASLIRRTIWAGFDVRLRPALHRFRTYLSPGTFVAALSEARVYGKRGTVIAPGQVVLGDVSREFRTPTSQLTVFRQKRLPKPRYLRGTCAVLAGPGGTNYYHWMVDILPRVELLRLAGWGPPMIDRFLVSPLRMSFQRETLRAVGVPADTIVECGPDTHAVCERLIVPSFPGDIHHPPYWVHTFLRRHFGEDSHETNATGEYLYLSREDAGHRRVTNEDCVRQRLAKLGYETVVMSGRSVYEQAAIMRGAKRVVAAHGAALTNVVFASEGLEVTEVLSPTYLNMCFWGLANHASADYRAVIGKSGGIPIGHDTWRIRDSIEVDIDSLEHALGR